MAFFLLFGTVFAPAGIAEAGLFSSLFVGSQALADTDANTAVSLQSGDNLQTMPILQVGNTTNANSNPVILDNALQSALGTTASDTSLKDQTNVYVVRKGDSLSQIAEMFGVSTNTILSANDLKKDQKLVPGDVLFILPISGIEHTIAKGQTLKGIAKLYKVNVSDIAQFNGIAENAKLVAGDQLIIPGGEMVDEGGDQPAANLGSAISRDKKYYETHPLQFLVDYFIYPLPLGLGRKTQGLHGPGNRGIDIGAPKGTPIYASASGTVLIAKVGWSGGYGNMIIIEHPNGTKTLYAHMSKLGARTGAQVSRGEIIGYVGSTGRSTGPHIHFEVFNARNPGADWSWAN